MRRPLRSGRVVLLLCVAIPLLFRAGRAQDATTGAIQGSVTDGSGAIVTRAEVVLREAATRRETTLTTGGDGTFVAAALPPGTYSAEVRAKGFGTTLLEEVVVSLGETSEISPVLRPAGTSTEITVEAEPEPVATGAVSNVLLGAEIGNLPLDGRRWQAFAILTPQASFADGMLEQLSFRGLPPTQNSTRLDGVDDDQSYSAAPRGSGRDSGPEAEDETDDPSNSREVERGYAAGTGAGRHPGMPYTFSEAAVREFRVTGQNDSALYGHAAGGVITTVSRSGSDALHGSLFYLLRTSAFAARDPFAVATHYQNGFITSEIVKPHDLRQQFGGTLGGAAVPDRLFFFYTFDGHRRNFPAISSPESGTFYALTAIQQAVLGTRGVSASQTEAALNYLDSLTGTETRHQDQTVNFGKLDWVADERDRLSVEYNRARLNSPGGGRTAAVVNRGLASFGNAEAKVDSGIVRWVHTGNARLSNEMRAQYGRDLHLERPQAPLPQEPAIGAGGYAPEVAIGPQGLNFGTPASSGQGPAPDERRAQAAEVLTWVHGHHLIQVGGDFSSVQDHVEQLANATGTFNYDSGTTDGHAGGLVDWITDYTLNVNHIPNGGCPSISSTIHLFCFRSYTQSFGPQDVRFRTQEWAGFAQDDWRLRKQLTFSAGIRYEYEFLPLPQKPNADLDRAFGMVGATSRFPEDRNNVGPRLGIAWQPFRSKGTTLRAGYGFYFGRLPGATIRSALANTALPSSTTRIRILPAVETACPQVSNQGFGYPCAFLATPPTGVVSTTSATVFDRRFRLPVSQQATFSVEQSVRRGLTLQAGYQLSLTRQLTNSTDINIAPSSSARSFLLKGGRGVPGVEDGDTFSLPLYTQRVDTAYGPVTDVLSNVNASYNALVVEARQRSRSSLEMRASWTWSKSIDYGGDSGAVPPTNGQLDPFDVRYDKGLSNLNYPHKLVASAVWTPQIAVASSRWRRALAGGWSAAPILVESSGRPYSYNLFGGTRLPGGHESLNGSGGAVYLPTVGRNVLRLPEQLDLDLRVGREIRVSEHDRLRFTAEVFNLPNHRNVTAVTQRAFLVGTAVNGVFPLVFQDAATIAAEGLNTQPFGSFTAVSQGQGRERQVQLGARLEF